MTPLITRARALAEKATKGPGKILHTKKISEPGMKEELLFSIAESIDSSIAFDGGHEWFWIQTDDGIKIGEFGCGPTSKTNAIFWGESRELVPQLCDALELAIEALKVISSEHKPRHVKEEYWMGIDHAVCAAVLANDTLIARNALQKLRGEG